MYITAETILELEQRYGKPDEAYFGYEMTDREFEVVLRSQKHGRSHDVTMFIVQGDKVAVIRKPMYPPGAYRAPSGGVEPGEDFERGALREAYEETGLIVGLDTYVFRSNVTFSCRDRAIDWTSHVFTAKPFGGVLEPVDTHEIVEARLASRDEILGNIREALLASGSTGLRYRAELTDAVMSKLIEQRRI